MHRGVWQARVHGVAKELDMTGQLSTHEKLACFCRGQGPHLGMTGEPRGVSRVVAGYSSFDGEYSLPHVLGQGSPIFHSSSPGSKGSEAPSLWPCAPRGSLRQVLNPQAELSGSRGADKPSEGWELYV